MSDKIQRLRRKPFSGQSPLTVEEQKRFRALLNDEVFRKALARVMNMKPSAFSPTPGAQGANDRLFEIRGWEMFEHALYLQAEAQKPRGGKATESFPDQGLIDYEK